MAAVSGPGADFQRRLRISIEVPTVQVVFGVGPGRFTMRGRYSGKSLVESYLEG
jgi:hypothetical protein